MKMFALLLAGILITIFSFAQGNAYYDPAQAYVRLLLERDNGTYKLIGNYKVIGTCFLFGEKHLGNLYAKGESATNIYLSYNTYSQQVEFYSPSNPDKPLVKEANEVDSFTFKGGNTTEIPADLKFINAGLLKPDEKGFFQLVYPGTRFTLYKKYNSTLGYVSTNIVQADLRQFDLDYQYYYSDTASSGIKKIKFTFGGISKEFKSIKDISTVMDKDLFNTNPESLLKNLFELLNG